MTSVACIKAFQEAYRLRLTKETMAIYQMAVRNLLFFCEKPFQEITKRDIRNWLAHLEESFKPTTIYIRLSGIKLFYRYCLEEAHITKNPAESIPLPEIKENLPHYLEQEQLTKLRELVKEKIEEQAIVELLYTSGIRISELAAIQKEDINWSERIIHIRKGKGKKERIVLFTRACAEYLQAHLDKRTDELPFLFVNKRANGPIVVRTIQLRFEKYREALGFHFSVHTMRHTFAAHLAQKGMQLECIQELLGHEDPKQTHIYARLYNHARKLLYDEWM